SNSINVNPGSVLPSSFGFIVGFCRLSSMVILSLLCTLLGHGFAQGPPDPVEYHVAESFKSPVVPVAVRVAERRGEAATSGFALIGPGDNIVPISNVDLDEWHGLGEDRWMAVNFIRHRNLGKAADDPMIG